MLDANEPRTPTPNAVFSLYVVVAMFPIGRSFCSFFNLLHDGPNAINATVDGPMGGFSRSTIILFYVLFGLILIFSTAATGV